jgi:hypothetical protein
MASDEREQDMVLALTVQWNLDAEFDEARSSWEKVLSCFLLRVTCIRKSAGERGRYANKVLGNFLVKRAPPGFGAIEASTVVVADEPL